MRKIICFLLCFVIFIINIDIVKAASCDDEDMARLKGLAGGVSYNAEYIGDQVEASSIQDYKINFIGLTDEMYVSDSQYTFKINNDSESIKIESGSYDYEIYSKNCHDLRLKTITVDLPKFNIYSLKKSCYLDKYKNLDVCNPWYRGDINENQFYKIIYDYDDKVDRDENVSVIDNIKNFYLDNSLIFWGFIIFISLILIIIGIINHKKNILE